MQNKTKTKLWIVLILTTLVIGGGLASYIGSKEGLFKGVFFSTGEITQPVSMMPTVTTGGSAGSAGFQTGLDDGTQALGASTQDITLGTGYSYECANFNQHTSCIAYTECLWTDPDGGSCNSPTGVMSDGYQQEPVLEVSKDTSLSGSTISQGANDVLVGSFKLKNRSNSPITVDGMRFYKSTPEGSRTLDNNHLSDIKLYDKSGDGVLDAGFNNRLNNEGGYVSFSAGGSRSGLFNITSNGTKIIGIQADISSDAPVGRKFRFELHADSISTSGAIRTRLASGNTLPIRSASFTIGAGAATEPEPPPETPPDRPPPATPSPAAPAVTVTLATDTPAAREVNTGEFFEAAKINFAVENTAAVVFISSVIINAKNITGADALPLDKIDKIQLCKSSGGTASVCFPERDFDVDGATIETPGWFILPGRSSQNLIIKAKLKTNADSGKRFALGISRSDSITLDDVTPAAINGFPIWGNEMMVVTPLVCTGGRTNVGGICVCPAPLFEYVGGTAGTHYSPSACIPCTVAELITAGGFYCPRDLPAQPITCNSLSIAPDVFPSNNPVQNFTAVVEPAGFTGTVTWTHLKNGNPIETKTGRQALFPQLDATSVITANARPETSGRICSDQVLAGASVVTNDPPANDGGGGRYVRINRGGYDVGFDQTGAIPMQPAPADSANVATPAAPDLSSSQRLRSAPERGNTGPSAVMYVIAMAGIYGCRALRRKFKGSR